MKRLVSLLALASFGIAAIVACGGKEKPPMTPDSQDPDMQMPDAGDLPSETPSESTSSK
jgi:hypothetical protein